jgi:osmotically-inducible protein OsmY
MKNMRRCLLLILIAFSVSGLAATWSQSNNDLAVYRSADADTIVKAQLLTTYALNEQLRYYPIIVNVKQGVVSLNGRVENTIQKALAVGVAHAANGVIQVVDNLVVDASAPRISVKDSYGQKIQDLNITAGITSAFDATPGLGTFNITVSTLNGAVTLTGEVNTFAQKELAGKVAMKTPGVVMVNNNIKVVANI